ANTVDFFQAGLLGILLFAFAIIAHEFAARLRASDTLAAHQQTELDDLNWLNKHIIQRMRIGVVVLDSDQQIHAMNAASRTLLGLATDMAGWRLIEIAPRLTEKLDSWNRIPQSETGPFVTESHAILPSFSRLGRNVDAPTLIFLEDAS